MVSRPEKSDKNRWFLGNANDGTFGIGIDFMDELHIKKMACARIPTAEGEYQLCLYTNNHDEKEHLAVIMGDVWGKPDVLVRVHSECFTGDVLGSRRCDCGEQLQRAMLMIAKEGSGVLVYLRQEGRGIGLLDKLRAYNLQDDGYDTVEANLALGHQADERDYSVAAHILNDLGVASVRLLTNNPEKISRLRDLGVEVAERISLESTVHSDNAYYLFTKAQRMNHLLNLGNLPISVPGNGRH
jgi:3,4-dihydroxy 2-butanone 4-phosphate synthase/GTP cyclohydrolase II